jgi:Xaa-Pro aminopeptidase
MSQQSEAEALRRSLVAEKHAQAKTLLRDLGVDCWLTFQREGSDVLLPYVLGVDELVSQSALMIFADGPSVAIVMDYDATVVEEVFDEVHAYRSTWKEPLRIVLEERKPARIAINYDRLDDGIDGLTYGQYLLLTEALESIGFGSRLESASPVTSMVRQIKTPAEIERMRRACEITTHLLADVTGILKPGLTEMDVYEYLHEQMRAYGVAPSWDSAYCPGVMSSKRESGHTPPTRTALEAGDGLRVDFGVVSEGYASDLMRTWYLRKPGESAAPAEFQRAFDVVRDAIQLAADTIRPGLTGIEVDGVTRSFVEKHGFEYFHATGHQVGTRAHDGGLLLGPDNVRYGERSQGIIQEGMVFTLEPVFGPIRIEENVVVTAEGCEYLVPPQRELWLV